MKCRFDFEGARVFYTTHGSGKPMLLLHNGGASHRIWERQIEHFSASHRCIAFDLPGYGRSADAGLRTSLGFHVDWLDAFCTLHGIEGATLVGNCMGSAIALAYANAFPARVERLVLFHPLTKRTVLAGPYAPIFRLTTPRLRNALRALAMRLTTPRIFVKRAVRAHWGSGDRPDAALAAELARLYRQRGQLAALSDLLVDADAFAALDRLTLPPSFPRTLVVWGEENEVLPIAGGRSLARDLAPHRFVCVPGGGHLLMHQHFTRANRIMEKFFDAPSSVDRDPPQLRS